MKSDMVIEKGISILKPMKDLMSKALSIERVKQDDCIEEVNAKIHNGNLYIKDKYGLLIREKDKKNNSITGYRTEGKEKVNVFVNELYSKFHTASEVRQECMKELKRKMTKRQVVYKLYEKLYGEAFNVL
jgi:hypothetical protein